MKIIQEKPYLIVENCKGFQYELHIRRNIKLRGGKTVDVPYFTKIGSELSQKHTDERAELPANKTIQENPRNGFLTAVNKIERS